MYAYSIVVSWGVRKLPPRSPPNEAHVVRSNPTLSSITLIRTSYSPLVPLPRRHVRHTPNNHTYRDRVRAVQMANWSQYVIPYLSTDKLETPSDPLRHVRRDMVSPAVLLHPPSCCSLQVMAVTSVFPNIPLDAVVYSLSRTRSQQTTLEIILERGSLPSVSLPCAD